MTDTEDTLKQPGAELFWHITKKGWQVTAGPHRIKGSLRSYGTLVVQHDAQAVSAPVVQYDGHLSVSMIPAVGAAQPVDLQQSL